MADFRGWRVSRGTLSALILLAIFLVPVFWQDMPVIGAMRLAWIDSYQVAAPRQRHAAPVVIVAIDEASLERFGQWPWPRTLIADLIEKLRAAGASAIGIDLLFPEPDRLSPEQLAPLVQAMAPELAARLKSLRRNDASLAAAIKSAPVVLGIAGLETDNKIPEGRLTPSVQRGGEALPFLRHYSSTLRSMPEIDAAARGHGLLSADTEGGVVRRVPMVAAIGALPVLPLSLETLRLASGSPFFVVRSGAGGIESVGFGGMNVPVQSDGRLWVHYTPHAESRFVSAAAILAGEADMTQFERALVLVGITGIGAVDFRSTPLGERMPGVEIHAQVLENIFDGALLRRPGWAPWIEGGTLIVFGILLVFAVPRLAPRQSAFWLAVMLVTLVAAGFFLYKIDGVLLDASVPGMALALLFAVMISTALSESNMQRVALRDRLQHERESAARLTGELDAARRIQTGMLPKPEAIFPGERRFDLFASMDPAREVGGDLYDFFMLDDERLFFLIGDVSGKGLPASIFMAVSKALCKNAGLRHGERVDWVLREASTEISRENPESLFVTAIACVLDLRDGTLHYCNAGHPQPYALSPDEGKIVRLEEGGGPPLCVMESFDYVSATRTLKPGEMLCLVTDGVVEAENAAGELYGQDRLHAVLERRLDGPDELGEAIRADVAHFSAGIEPADDLTLLILRWNGTPA